MTEILELNKDKVLNKKTKETEQRNFDLPQEYPVIKDGEEEMYQPGPIRDCEDHDHLDTQDCDTVIVYESETFTEFDDELDDIRAEFQEKEMKI